MRAIATIGLTLFAVVSAAHAEAPELHVYNWSDYIAPDTIANFTKESGIAVTYDVYDGNEVLEAKLLAGQSGYDVVVPSASPFMAREITAGAFLTLDKAKLPNLKNLDPPCWRWPPRPTPATRMACPICGASPGSATTRRWWRRRWATERRATAWRCCSIRRSRKKLSQCGISLLDTPQEVFPAALAYLGLDPQEPRSRRSRQGDGAAARRSGPMCASSIRRNTSTTSPTATSASRWLFGRRDPGAQPRRRGQERGQDRLSGAARRGHRCRSTCSAIPKDAPHPENALRFIDYILRPEVIAAISDAVSYPNPNAAATALVKPEIRDDPGIYPPDAVKKLFYVDLPAPRDYERARTRAWNRVKAGG